MHYYSTIRLILNYRPSKGGRLSGLRHCSQYAAHAQSCVSQWFSWKTNFCPQRDSNLGPLAQQASMLPLDQTKKCWTLCRVTARIQPNKITGKGASVHGCSTQCLRPLRPQVKYTTTSMTHGQQDNKQNSKRQKSQRHSTYIAPNVTYCSCYGAVWHREPSYRLSHVHRHIPWSVV